MTTISEENYNIFKGMAQNNEAFSCVPTRLNLEIHNISLTHKGYIINPENTMQELNPRVISLDILPKDIRELFRSQKPTTKVRNQDHIDKKDKDKEQEMDFVTKQTKEELKICATCDEPKHISSFGRVGKGYRKVCKSCFNRSKPPKKEATSSIDKKGYTQIPQKEKKENFKLVDMNYIKEKIKEAYELGYKEGKATLEVYYPSTEELLDRANPKQKETSLP